MIALLTFHLPLLRLILCGGGGLPSAWGPLKHADEEDKWAWGIAFQLDRLGRPRPSSVECLGAG